MCEIYSNIAKSLEAAKSVEAEGNIDNAIDIIYENIDFALKNSEYDAINELFKNIDTRSLSIDIVLALLVATRPARSKLSHRAQFLAEAKNNRCQDIEDLFDGLT